MRCSLPWLVPACPTTNTQRWLPLCAACSPAAPPRIVSPPQFSTLRATSRRPSWLRLVRSCLPEATRLQPEPVLTVTFEPPGRPVNHNDRDHWSKRAELARLWRTASFYAARQAMHDTGVTRLEGRHRVSVEFPVRGRRRRDPSNWSVKNLIDGALVDSGLLPDDSAEYVTVDEPTLKVGGTHVVITIAPAPLAQ